MSSVDSRFIVGMHTSFLIVGVLANAFILIVHFQGWLKSHDFNPSTLIINTIALINILFQGATAFNEVSSLMFMEFYIQGVAKFMPIILPSLAFSSLWCSTCLCFYYCIKIVNFSGSFFYKLKVKIPALVPWLLIISVAISWLVGVSGYWDLYLDIKSETSFTAHNVTLTFSFNPESRCKCLFQIYMVFAALAFVLIFITSVSILASLSKHMIQMKKNNEGSGNSRIRSHLSAAKTVTSLLLLYMIFYVCLSSLFSDAKNRGSLMFVLTVTVVCSFPTFNSIVLIMGNRRLSNSLKKLLGIRPLAANSEVTVATY